MPVAFTSSIPDGSPDELVFVYGTLRKGAANYLRMKGAERVAQAVIQGRLLKIGWFPVVVLDSQATTWVLGDVFRVEGLSRQAFHEYEGLAGGAVEGQDCRLITAKVYSFPGSQWGWQVRFWEWIGPSQEAEVIASGDWLDSECPRSAPLFTLIAAACTVSLPVCLIASANAAGDLDRILMVGGMLAPIPGWVAIVFAGRRRERRELMRFAVSVVLAMLSIPCGIFLVAMASALVERIF